MAGIRSYASDLPRGDFKSLLETEKGRVVEIIDPLTIRLEDGQIVSLVGLDYPDLDYFNPGNFSIMTLKILKDFLIGQEVVIYQTKEDGLGRINRMNHKLAHVVSKSDGTWVQGLMLSLGLARVRTTKHNPEMASQMYEIESAARISKNGVWAVQGYQTLDAASASPFIGSFQIVEGTVTKTAMQKNRLFINFGKDWRRDFTVSISASNRRLFASNNLDPQGWEGKKLRVRGWLESFNGPYIEIDHPQQFELLFLSDPVAKDKTTSEKNISSEENEKNIESEQQKNESKKTVIRRGNALPQ